MSLLSTCLCSQCSQAYHVAHCPLARSREPLNFAVATPSASDNSQSDAISALRDLHAACLRADNAGELSELIDGKLLCRAKDVLLQHT